jgi:hypothetical protein
LGLASYTIYLVGYVFCLIFVSGNAPSFVLGTVQTFFLPLSLIFEMWLELGVGTFLLALPPDISPSYIFGLLTGASLLLNLLSGKPTAWEEKHS